MLGLFRNDGTLRCDLGRGFMFFSASGHCACDEILQSSEFASDDGIVSCVFMGEFRSGSSDLSISARVGYGFGLRRSDFFSFGKVDFIVFEFSVPTFNDGITRSAAFELFTN